MEADISILRKTGHFYFALTHKFFDRRNQFLQSCFSPPLLPGSNRESTF